jgi:hypothetical protein
MKKNNFLILLGLFSVLIFTVGAQSFSGGTGVQNDPYLIGSTADLMSLDSAYSSENPATPELVYFKMIADVDLAGETWVPFNASSDYNKHVHFDGDGHVIKNMTVTGKYAGMFGVLCGTVKNLGIIDATVTGSSYHGVIAGYLGIQSPASAAYTGLIENCYTTGTLETTEVRGGGIVGYIGGKYEDAINTIRNCYSTVNISSTTTTIGGIAGAAMNAFVIENSYSTGKLITTGRGYVAGILAQQRNGDAASQLKGCVVRNDSLIADKADATKTGRVSGSLYGNTVVTDNLASDNIFIQLTNEPTYLTEFNETEIIGDRYDGVTTADAALGQQATYAGIGWDFTSTWSPIFHNVYPIHQWLAARADYKQISGFTSSADASLSDLKFKGTTINDFSTDTYSYDVKLAIGSAVPTVEDMLASKTHANATYELTRSSADFPTTITVAVTAEDEVTTQNYVINFTEDIASGIQDTRLNYSIASNNGILIISEVLNKNIGVYSYTGQLIYSTNAAVNTVQIPLNKGVYLVRVNNSTSKVIVK